MANGWWILKTLLINMIKQLLLVGLGGMLGSMLRYATGLVLKSTQWPAATLVVNLSGSFLMGLVLGIAIKNESFDNNWRLFLATGVCGGFTTFSAFSVEGLQLLQQQRYSIFFLYFALSILLGLGATWLGFILTK
jgi:fluoride exporter